MKVNSITPFFASAARKNCQRIIYDLKNITQVVMATLPVSDYYNRMICEALIFGLVKSC